MSNEDPRVIIERLRAEIDSVEGDRPEVRERLDALVAELSQHLEAPAESAPTEDLMDRLQASIEHYEVEYPRATALLNDLMVKLGSMGI